MTMDWERITAAHRTGRRLIVAWRRGSTAAVPNPVGAFWSGVSDDDPFGAWVLDTGQHASGSYAPTYCMPMPDAPEGE